MPPSADVCVFDMALTMEDVLLRGKYLGLRRVAGIQTGLINVDWVYNPSRQCRVRSTRRLNWRRWRIIRKGS